MINFITSTSVSALQNGLLIATNIAVGVTVTGLIALKLIGHFEDAPEIRTLACTVGFERDDCPDYTARLRETEERERQLTADLASMDEARRRLEDERASFEAEAREFSEQLDSLRGLLEQFDSLIGFEHIDSPNGRHNLSVGTLYRTFVELEDATADHQCYFNLPDGNSGEHRSLYLRKIGSSESASLQQIRAANIDAETLAWAQERCRPLTVSAVSP